MYTRWRSNNKRTAMYVLLIIAIMCIAAFTYFHIKGRGLIPGQIDSQLSFQALIPTSASVATKIDKSSFKYDGSAKVLSFNASQNGEKIVVTEQQYPDVLIFDKLVGTLNEYAEIQTKAGNVALTKPKALNGLQTAVLSTYNGNSGVLLFAKPDSNLTQGQWTDFFNSLDSIK